MSVGPCDDCVPQAGSRSRLVEQISAYLRSLRGNASIEGAVVVSRDYLALMSQAKTNPARLMIVGAPVPLPFLVDVLDVAAAAELWRRGRWDGQAWSSCIREGPSGISLPELTAGAEWVDEFLQSFEYDEDLVGNLRLLDVLSGVDARFWSFLTGRRFDGWQQDFRPDGERIVGGTVSTIVGRAGDVLLFRAGVREILSYCISVASEADQLSRPVPARTRLIDGGSATSVGHGWSLLVASSMRTAGRRPEWRPSLMVGGGDPRAAVQDARKHFDKAK